ncbi:MAG: hypothetical protein ACRD2L_22245, partial [Terriglobia bacterium]
IRDYSRAIRIDPADAVAYLNRGLAMSLRGNRAEAEGDFLQCLRLAGDKRKMFEDRIKKMEQAAAN